MNKRIKKKLYKYGWFVWATYNIDNRVELIIPNKRIEYYYKCYHKLGDEYFDRIDEQLNKTNETI